MGHSSIPIAATWGSLLSLARPSGGYLIRCGVESGRLAPSPPVAVRYSVIPGIGSPRTRRTGLVAFEVPDCGCELAFQRNQRIMA